MPSESSSPLIAHLNLARGFRGGERQTELLIRELSEMGRRQVLVARSGEELANRCAGVRGLEIRSGSASVVAAARACRTADLVHVHHGRSVHAGYLARLMHRTPWLITRRIQKGPGNKLSNRIMYRSADLVVALSQSIRASVRALDEHLRVEIIPSSAAGMSSDVEEAAKIRRAVGGGPLIGHIGALDDGHKGQLQIIEIARRFADEGVDAQFMLVGSGGDEALLRRRATDLPNVHFAGQVERVGDYLKAFDVFLYPSRHEGLGSALLDAMQFGLPIVANRVGGIPEIVTDGQHGFLFEVDDVEGQAGALRRLLSDPVLRADISDRNRVHATSYAPRNMAVRYADFYDEILAARDVGSTR